MAKERKSIVDEALLESREIEKAFEANAKEILTRSMGSDIEEMVKENLENSGGLNEDDDEELELMASDEMDGDMDLDIDLDDEDDDMDLDIDFEDDEEEIDFDVDLDGEVDDDLETVDLTGASDSEVVTVFKKMGPEDEIEVVQTGDSIDIKDNQTGAEYRVELGGSEEMGMDMNLDMDMDMDLDSDDDTEIDLDDLESMETMDSDDLGESVIYEIEIDDEDGMGESAYMDDEEDYEDNMKEASRTLASGRKWGRKGLDKPKSAPRHLRQESRRPMNTKLIKENTVLKNNIKSVIKENEELKSDYNSMVDALKEFKNKLNEVAVFNSNLTYAVRLFTENTTTKEEKLDIIKRFDGAKTLKESKNIYKQLVKEVSSKKPIKESINEKINETKSSGSSAQINESSVYVNPEFEKMKKLWSYDYKQ